jgi:hypothetical protein
MKDALTDDELSSRDLSDVERTALKAGDASSDGSRRRKTRRG